MEIERKYLIRSLPEFCLSYPFTWIEQGYLCTDPVVRVRRDGDAFYLTYKGKGLLAREEYNLSLTREAYDHLIQKADGIVLTKRRYRIPLDDAVSQDPQGKAERTQETVSSSLTIELDIFEAPYSGLILAEVEFPTLEEAEAFIPPRWFGPDVTFSGEYQNSRLSRGSGNGRFTG